MVQQSKRPNEQRKNNTTIGSRKTNGTIANWGNRPMTSAQTRMLDAGFHKWDAPTSSQLITAWLNEAKKTTLRNQGV